jgi:hypothetical protein
LGEKLNNMFLDGFYEDLNGLKENTGEMFYAD